MQLLDGKWVSDDLVAAEIRDGAFERKPSKIRDWITPDGRPGPDGQRATPAEPGRYHLFVALSCPWASRTLAYRKLKKLDRLLGVSVAEPVIGEGGWTYAEPQDTGPESPPIRHQYQLYLLSDPRYSGKATVPVLWDRKEARIVNNESADIIRMLNDSFDGLTGETTDLYPPSLRPLIDGWNERIYPSLNNGVYRAGFASAAPAYEAAFDEVFATLDAIDAHLAGSRYLAGEHLTEADWRLFPTLARFDAAYHGVFKCNLRKITEYAHLPHYLRELYQWPGIAETVSVDHIKRGYWSFPHLNPNGIVPKGPAIDLSAPHDRERLPGRGIARRGEA